MNEQNRRKKEGEKRIKWIYDGVYENARDDIARKEKERRTSEWKGEEIAFEWSSSSTARVREREWWEDTHQLSGARLCKWECQFSRNSWFFKADNWLKRQCVPPCADTASYNLTQIYSAREKLTLFKYVMFYWLDLMLKCVKINIFSDA